MGEHGIGIEIGGLVQAIRDLEKTVVDSTNRIVTELTRIDRTSSTTNDMIMAAFQEAITKASDPPDGELPEYEEGACPRCAQTKIAIPEEEGRELVRVCLECGCAWRVRTALESGS